MLDRAFREYTVAYSACLHACERHYDAPRLLSLATYALDATTNQPGRNARPLSKRWFSAETAAAVARFYTATAAPLENRLRQSLREHIALTLYSYAHAPSGVVPARRNQLRPLLAINRGMRRLYVAVVTTRDASRALDVQIASGKELLEIQQAHERAREERQRRGVASAQAPAARRIPARDRRQRRIGDHHCDSAANGIVALAQRHGAQVVLEDFTRIMDGRIPYLLRPIIHRRQFEKLAKRIDERLEVVGLPPARQIGAYHIAHDCPRCGLRQDERAVEQSGRPGLFVCAHCGEIQDRDVTAAANVARRLV